jgi:hypothetical protein
MQVILRHSKLLMTMALYTREDSDKTRAAQANSSTPRG